MPGNLKNKLNKIKIYNFRNFSKESRINFTFPLTVIVGKNGSGKTTLMKAMKSAYREPFLFLCVPFGCML
ncbi:AAA family ATPase [Colibacter massiliensis]|uniref:AAA family ATPase n=1 Tax=Colibacter massiliensis TaxID=1852379 RepID=UPI00346364AC